MANKTTNIDERSNGDVHVTIVQPRMFHDDIHAFYYLKSEGKFYNKSSGVLSIQFQDLPESVQKVFTFLGVNDDQ